MANFQPPPTWAEVILVDQATGKGKFNPVWLKWFVDLVGTLNTGGGSTLDHNALDGLQGGSGSERYHLSAAQVPASGTYGPTITGVTNVSDTDGYSCQYLRVGNTVVVSGRLGVDPTAAGLVEVGISLPVASNFAAAEDCCGSAHSGEAPGDGAAIVADATNNRAQMAWFTTDVDLQLFSFIFAYRVI